MAGRAVWTGRLGSEGNVTIRHSNVAMRYPHGLNGIPATVHVSPTNGIEAVTARVTQASLTQLASRMNFKLPVCSSLAFVLSLIVMMNL